MSSNKTQTTIFALSMLFAASVSAEEGICSSEYERGRREMGGYAEMMGIIEGAIYGHSLTIASPKICLVGTPKEKVQKIANAFGSQSHAEPPLELDDVPSKEQAQKFLERFFPCK